MSNEIFASDMFVDVTEEQQQMIAGGTDYKGGANGVDFKDIVDTSFKNITKAFAVDLKVKSDKDGSAVFQNVEAMKDITDTAAKVKKLLKL